MLRARADAHVRDKDEELVGRQRSQDVGKAVGRSHPHRVCQRNDNELKKTMSERCEPLARMNVSTCRHARTVCVAEQGEQRCGQRRLDGNAGARAGLAQHQSQSTQERLAHASLAGLSRGLDRREG